MERAARAGRALEGAGATATREEAVNEPIT
jgi:hypothetical protein